MQFIRLTFLLIGLFLLSFKNTAYAWDLSDLRDESLSPFTTSASNVVIVGSALTLTVLLFEDSIVDPTQSEFADDKPLGSWSKFGDLAGQMVPNAVYILGQAVAGATGDKKGYRRGMGMLKASAYASAVTTTLKYTIREPRPGNGSARNSFPSGHATTAFAFAGYVYQEHGWMWGVPALAMASFVGASRLNDNRHYLHDVLAGATIGLAYGISISKNDKLKEGDNLKEPEYTFFPIFNGDMKGIAFRTEF